MTASSYKWVLFFLLSVTWGSSFILMRIGLEKGLSPYQVAALRIFSGGLVMLPFAWRSYPKIPRNKLGLVFLSGILGSLLPAFLFCLAEEGIDSSLAGTLNCLTPVFVILIGAIFFGTKVAWYKIAGIVIAFTGSVLLLVNGRGLEGNIQYGYIAYVLLATISYGLNVNLLSRYLKDVGSLDIAAVALVLNAIPAGLLLLTTGYFTSSIPGSAFWKGTAAAIVLGIFGTAIATVLFYSLVKKAGGLFASMVTYGIPFVAIGWGLYFGERFTNLQFACLPLILGGVYLANRNPTPVGTAHKKALRTRRAE